MNHRKSSMGKSRDLGMDAGAGKGDADRVSDSAAFGANFSKIEWPVLAPEGFRKVGTKQVKSYGKPSEVNPQWVINPEWAKATIDIDFFNFKPINKGPEPALEDFESWDR